MDRYNNQIAKPFSVIGTGEFPLIKRDITKKAVSKVSKRRQRLAVSARSLALSFSVGLLSAVSKCFSAPTIWLNSIRLGVFAPICLGRRRSP